MSLDKLVAIIERGIQERKIFDEANEVVSVIKGLDQNKKELEGIVKSSKQELAGVKLELDQVAERLNDTNKTIDEAHKLAKDIVLEAKAKAKEIIELARAKGEEDAAKAEENIKRMAEATLKMVAEKSQAEEELKVAEKNLATLLKEVAKAKDKVLTIFGG